MAIRQRTPDTFLLKGAIFQGLLDETDFAAVLEPNPETGGFYFVDHPQTAREVTRGLARLTVREGPDLYVSSMNVSRRLSSPIINFMAWAHTERHATIAANALRNWLNGFFPDMGSNQCFSGSYPLSAGGLTFDKDCDLYVAALSWCFSISLRSN